MSEVENNVEERPSRGVLWVMLGGVGLAYTWFGSFAARFLYPSKDRPMSWQFVTLTDRMGEGDSMLYRAPSGEPINIARRTRNGDVSDFVALSSTCPHLGCQVHWESQHNRFFCPCHNGTFDAEGMPTGGPPAEANQTLPRYELMLDGNKLFIEVPVGQVAEQRSAPDGGTPCPRGPGHDPILALDGKFHRGRARSRDGRA